MFMRGGVGLFFFVLFYRAFVPSATDEVVCQSFLGGGEAPADPVPSKRERNPKGA